MKFFTVLCLISLAALVSCQQTENEVKFIIDPFTEVSPTIVILIPTEGSAYLEPVSNFVSHPTIMGGERDLQLTVTGGDGNLILSTGVSGGVYTASTPNEARGNSLLQLDGTDGTMVLNTSGLFGHPNNNFMNENAFAFRVIIESDLPGTVIFRVFSGGSAQTSCSLSVATPGDDTPNEFILPYSDFTGTCDFSNVGALEIFILMNDNIDVLLSDWSTWGPVVTCVCFCPAFTCDLRLDFDDDYFSYYVTSDFGVIDNPTTDLSTIYTSDTFIYNPTTDLSTIYTSDTFFFDIGVTSFFTSFDFETFSSGFTTFTSFNPNNDDDDNNTTGSSPSDSSSDAGLVSVSVMLLSAVLLSMF